MSISKISRSLVVALFVVLISFLSVIDFVYIKNNSNLPGPGGLIKFGYVCLIVVLVSLYTYVREKLSRLKLQKSIATLYKYTYIILIMLATTFFKVYNLVGEYSKKSLILYFVLSYLIGFFTQRIIFNISKSDVLSVLGMFVAFTLPNVIDDKMINLNSKFITFIVFISIYVVQKLIDELKQLNIKNKKYIIQALVVGICIGFSTILGVNYLIWEAIAVLSLFITSNLDSTSLNLSSKPNNAIKKRKNNYFIYKIERIKISKLLISLLIIGIVSSGIYFGGRVITHKLALNQNSICSNIVNDLTVGIHSQIETSFRNIKDQSYAFVGLSTKFYMICYIYILVMEILSIVLRRKYDTKSTIIKLMFIGIYTVMVIFRLNVLYFQPVLTMLLVIVCIVNTTNIYYNREERIKMIEA